MSTDTDTRASTRVKELDTTYWADGPKGTGTVWRLYDGRFQLEAAPGTVVNERKLKLIAAVESWTELIEELRARPGAWVAPYSTVGRFSIAGSVDICVWAPVEAGDMIHRFFVFDRWRFTPVKDAEDGDDNYVRVRESMSHMPGKQHDGPCRFNLVLPLRFPLDVYRAAAGRDYYDRRGAASWMERRIIHVVQ